MARVHLSPADLAALARQVTLAGGALEVAVRGHSMRPWIADGERVRLGPLDPAGPEPGEVLLVSLGGEARLHRYLGQAAGPRGPWLLVAGDAQPGPPERVEPGAVIARVLAVRRGARLLLQPRRLLRLALGRLLGLPSCVRRRF